MTLNGFKTFYYGIIKAFHTQIHCTLTVITVSQGPHHLP